MKLSVSNIAWEFEERLAAYGILQRAGVKGLEIAPGLFFAGEADAFVPSASGAKRAIAEAEGAGLTLTSMQSLLFGVQGAALFGSPEQRATFEKAMLRAISLAGRFGIPNLVFGSPGQRKVPDHLSETDALQVAAEQFRKLGEAAQANGTVIAMEANPAAYGTNFLNTFHETAAFVDLVDHPAITLILDTGALKMNHETADVLALVGRLSHVHLSEPNLAAAPAEVEYTRSLFSELAQAGYCKAVSIEMKRVSTGLKALERSVATLVTALGKSGAA